MSFAEKYAFPTEAEIGGSIPRTNDFKDLFYVRWGSIWFDVHWGAELNVKVVLKVYRTDNTCEQFIVDTDAYDVHSHHHKRVTRDFCVHPFAVKLGHVKWVAFSFIVHLRDRSIPSQHDYMFMDGAHVQNTGRHRRHVTLEHSAHNSYRTREVDA